MLDFILDSQSLKSARAKNRLTREKLSNLLGEKIDFVNNIEFEDSKISIETVEKLSDILNATPYVGLIYNRVYYNNEDLAEYFFFGYPSPPTVIAKIEQNDLMPTYRVIKTFLRNLVTYLRKIKSKDELIAVISKLQKTMKEESNG